MNNLAPKRARAPTDVWLEGILEVVAMPLLASKFYWTRRYRDGQIPSTRFVQLLWLPPLALCTLAALLADAWSPEWVTVGKHFLITQFEADAPFTVLAVVALYAISAAAGSMLFGSAFVLHGIESKNSTTDFDNLKGSARFATAQDIRNRKTSKYAINIGEVAVPGSPNYMLDTHALFVAPTGTGKGAGFIVKTLLRGSHKGSMLVLDPKGECVQITARRRRELGQKVVVVAPFGGGNGQQDSYDWFDGISSTDGGIAVLDADSMAATLQPVSGGKNAYFEGNAQFCISRLLLVCKFNSSVPNEKRIELFRSMLTGGRLVIKYALASMAAHGLDDVTVIIEQFAGWLEGVQDEALSQFLSTAQESTRFLDIPQFRRCMSKPTFAIATLRDEPTTLYVVIPDKYIAISGVFMRLLLQTAYNSATATPPKTPHKWVWLIDEAWTLGACELLLRIISIGRGSGLLLAAFFQDTGQIKKHYGREGITSWLANAVWVVFGCKDPETKELVSKQLGQTTYRYNETSLSKSEGQRGSASASVSEKIESCALMTPYQVGNLSLQRALVIDSPSHPVLLRKSLYFKERKWRKHADPNLTRGEWAGKS